jgi:hypothetical protein
MNASPDLQVKPFVCEYRHEGRRHELILHAYDFKDAEARVASLHSVEVRGELVGTVPWYDAPLAANTVSDSSRP